MYQKGHIPKQHHHFYESLIGINNNIKDGYENNAKVELRVHDS